MVKFIKLTQEHPKRYIFLNANYITSILTYQGNTSVCINEGNAESTSIYLVLETPEQIMELINE